MANRTRPRAHDVSPSLALDKPACECGIFGAFGSRRAAEWTYFGLYALQHRGQESSGIAVSDGAQLTVRKGMGEIADVFPDRSALRHLTGHAAIGHNRYSTTGASMADNAQPLLMRFKFKQMAAAHNGNITNAGELKTYLERGGAIFQTSSDSELVLHLYARSRKRSTAARLTDALGRLEGAYAILFLTDDELIVARDPLGFRPLALGKRNGAWVVASETCAFDLIGARYVRDVEPGEVLVISKSGLSSHYLPVTEKRAFCIFEHIYFARPDSRIFEESVDKVRRRLGQQLAREHPADADIVISVPDSSNTAALGFAEESGLKLEVGLIRNHYVGRTFILPQQDVRDLDVKIKFNTVRGVLRGKRVVVVDDSIVRGTTAGKLVRLIREAGAREVHFRVSSPPIISPCFYGIDMPTKRELIASTRSIEAIRRRLGVDTLGYLSLDGMLSLSTHPKTSFCAACFSGRYPTRINRRSGKLALG
ncbi:MAG TPA: amidophosphoribosyltransferase [Acidobacteriota bacterium]|nr:amidophosphoribosyltransferase [Acidobacteriota bacterium]